MTNLLFEFYLVKQRVTIKEKASTWDETNESLLADNVEEVNGKC